MDPNETVTPATQVVNKLPMDQVPCRKCTSQENALKIKCGFNHTHLPLSLGQTIEGVGTSPNATDTKPKLPRDQVRCGRCTSNEMAKTSKCGFNHDHLPPSLGQTRDAVVEEPTKTGGGVAKKPCRDFTSNGSCPRGDTCKFSHVVESPEVVVTPIPEVKNDKKGGKADKPAVLIAAGGSKASLEAGGVKAPSEKDDLAALVAKVLAEKVSEFVKVIKISGITNDIDVSKLSEEDLKMMINLSFSSSIPKPKGKGKKEGK
jgi:hypothetical protein